MTNVHILERLDQTPIPADKSECRLVVFVRDEMMRLPFLLEYYRRLGVSRFLVIDNGSTDGSLSFLLSQSDCHVFRTTDLYREARQGLAWQRRILDEYCNGQWVVIADADEQLVYPRCEKVRLPDFCRYLDSLEVEGVYAAMVDMYNNGPLSEATYQPGSPFIEASPYFDGDYKFSKRMKPPFSKAPFPENEVLGGPRLRCFYPEFRKHSQLKIGIAKALRKLRYNAKKVGINVNVGTRVPPVLFKVPLIKWNKDFFFHSAHEMNPIRLAPETAALLHFKYFSDFHERVLVSIKRGEKFDGSSEYARYFTALRQMPDLSFMYEGSIKYRDSAQLVDLGILQESQTFRKFSQFE